MLELHAGPPPSRGAEILIWANDHRHTLMLFSEALCFAMAFMVPAFAALHRVLSPSRPQRATSGCGLVALAMSVLAVTVVVQGRLVYPVFDIQAHSADQAELVVAITYGAFHLVALLMAVATVLLASALWETARGVGILGMLAAACDVVAGYPDHVGPKITFACGAVFAAWFAAVGVWLLRRRSERAQ
ncbi:MAG: DUF4386 family protein [Polyangiaceae bacterium]|nr:DUF4386 family protein [Polyangiaceae bacterium]